MSFDDDDDGPSAERPLSRVRIEELTNDQIEMAKLLGADPATAERTYVTFLHTLGDDVAKSLPGLRPNVVHERACPIVEWRGRMRVIMPDGDVARFARRADDAG